MSEFLEADTEEGDTILLFGNFRREDAPDGLTDEAKMVRAFLAGDDMGVDHALAVGLRKEFHGQEMFRQNTKMGLKHAADTLRDRAHGARTNISRPISTHEGFDEGFMIASYMENARAAQLVADVGNAVELELAKLGEQ